MNSIQFSPNGAGHLRSQVTGTVPSRTREGMCVVMGVVILFFSVTWFLSWMADLDPVPTGLRITGMGIHLTTKPVICAGFCTETNSVIKIVTATV
jgi:hypothetical protein